MIAFEDYNQMAAEIEGKYGPLGLVRCRSVKELLDRGAKAVVVATPTSTHAEVAEELLAGGADVLVEKPMTVTLAEADRLIAIAREKGRVLQVGHIERFNPAVVAVDDPRAALHELGGNRLHMGGMMFLITTSPRVAAAAIMNVPASIWSGMTA